MFTLELDSHLTQLQQATVPLQTKFTALQVKPFFLLFSLAYCSIWIKKKQFLELIHIKKHQTGINNPTRNKSEMSKMESILCFVISLKS